MASFNKVILMGNLTRDVELRYVGDNVAVTDVSLAINDKYKKGQEWVEEVCYVDAVLWGKTAEVAAEYLSKGSPLLVEGKLQQESWNDKESGAKRSKLKIKVDRMQMLGTKGGTSNNAPSKPTEESVDIDDDIPF